MKYAEFLARLKAFKRHLLENTSTKQPVEKKDIYDSFRKKTDGRLCQDPNSCVALRYLVLYIRNKMNGVEYFLQTEAEPPITMKVVRGKTMKLAGTLTVLGITLSY